MPIKIKSRKGKTAIKARWGKLRLKRGIDVEEGARGRKSELRVAKRPRHFLQMGQCLGWHFNGASYTAEGHFGQEGLSARSRDDGEGHGRNRKSAYLLVAAPWLRQAARKNLLLHEGRRPDLRA